MMKNQTMNAKMHRLIKEETTKSRKYMLHKLIKKHGFEKKEAEQIEESIYISTKSTLHERYTYKDKIIFDLGADFSDFDPDFINWLICASTIPFYQSLGDTIGYYDGKWEFNYGDIHVGPEFINEMLYEFINLGGINDFSVKRLSASDDTVLYLATYAVLKEEFKDVNDFSEKLKKSYLDALPLLENRHPGNTTLRALQRQKTIEWNEMPYDSKAKGAGAAMRCGCIGIFFVGRMNRRKLISMAIESSRITHNSAIAILSCITVALFTAYSLERVALNLWPHKLIKQLNSEYLEEYMKTSRPSEYEFYKRDKLFYMEQWIKYQNLFFTGTNPKTDLKFMKNPVLRYKYLADNFSKDCGIPGSCGDDALIMAYDSFLRCDGNLEKLILYSILHPGDSDTVGSIAFSWFGGYYHSPKNELLVEKKFKDLEFYDKIYDFLIESLLKMPKLYFHDIYLNVAKNILRNILINRDDK